MEELLLRIKQNQLDMMELRAKVIPDEEIAIRSMTTFDFKSYLESNKFKIGHALNKIYYSNKGTDPIGVYYIQSSDGGNIKGDQLNENFFDLLMKNDYIKKVILIALNTISSV